MTASTHKTDALGSEKIPRLVMRFTLTTFVALIINALYNLSDALFVSWGVGTDAMGGVSVVLPFVLIQSAISTTIGGGAAAIVSKKLGEGRAEEAGQVTLSAMTAFYTTAIFVTAVGFIFMEPIIRAMGVTEEIYPYAKEYFIIILAGNVFSTGFSAIIRAEGKMLYGLLIWVIPISINIALDAIFIPVLGWGVTGSAASTVIAQFLSFCMSMLFFTRRSVQRFRGARPNFKSIGSIIAIGVPSLVQIGSMTVTMLLINNVLSRTEGTAGVNTFSYVNRILTFTIMPFTAFSQALAPIAGYNYGAKSPERCRSALIFCAALSLGYAALAAVLTGLIPQQLLMIFTEDASIIADGALVLHIIAASYIFIPMPMLAGTVFQAIGKKSVALVMHAAQLIFMLPSVFIMLAAAGTGGLWWAYTISGAGASVLAAVIIFGKKKNMFVAPEVK